MSARLIMDLDRHICAYQEGSLEDLQKSHGLLKSEINDEFFNYFPVHTLFPYFQNAVL